MDDKEYSEEYENDEKKKFQITRGMVILAAIILVVIIIIIIIVVSVINSKKPEYETSDFIKLESRMEQEAPIYLSQNNIELTEEEVKIDLKKLLVENGGSIDSSKTKAAKICNGYVIAVKNETESYDAYISCSDMYQTEGYVTNDSIATTKKPTTKKDTEKPVITIIGEKEITINQGSGYNDEGAKAMDNVDGDITASIKVKNNVDTSKVGVYSVVYSVSDKAGNKAEASRKVTVVSAPTTTTQVTTKKTNTKSNVTTTKKQSVVTTTRRITAPPTITLKGSTVIEINQGTKYSDPGYSAVDSLGNDITSRVNVSGSVNINNPGTYTINYFVTDAYGNSNSKIRTVRVKSTSVAVQGITLSQNNVSLSVGQSKTLTVYFSPSNATNKSVSWSSSNPSVADVQNGTITGRSKGSATITATSSNGKNASAIVTVK